MRVECRIIKEELEAEGDRLINGVRALCLRCDHETESYGTGENSRKRCLVLMREECSMGERNFYVDEDES